MHATWGTAVVGVATLVSIAAAVLVYAGRPRHPSNRLLAAGLFIQGLAEASIFLQDTHLVAPQQAQMPLRVVFFVAALSWAMLYLLFLGTLRNRCARPLATTPVRLAVIAYWGVVVGTAIVRPWRSLVVDDSPPTLFLIGPILLMSVYGLIIAIDMVRLAPPTGAERRQAVAYLLAFGVRDATFLAFGFFAATATLDLITTYPDAFVGFLDGLPTLVNIVSASLLAYGILSTQLFDIDLKVKWTLHRGTVAASFIAVFFVVSELVSALLSERLGLVTGILATGILVFALAPLQGLADRIADRVFPDVDDTEEYRVVRKRELYQAAIRSAMADGIVTERERDILATLADRLGLSSVEALAVERSVQQGPGVER